MPIRIKCACGQALAVPDNLAGKTAKCPKCQNPLRIPAAGNTVQPPAKSPAAKPAPTGKPATSKKPAAKAAAPQQSTGKSAAAVKNDFDSLLDEVGLAKQTGPVCPKCSTPIKSHSSICTKCGLNFGTGEQLAAHRSSVETGQSYGNPFLDNAVAMMERDAQTDKRVSGAGMPWWVLGIGLLGLVLIGAMGVIIVDKIVGEAAPEGTFIGDIQSRPVLQLIMILVAVMAGLTGMISQLLILVDAAKRSVMSLLGCLFIPFYILIYAIMNWNDCGKSLLILLASSIVSGVAAGVAMSQ